MNGGPFAYHAVPTNMQAPPILRSQSMSYTSGSHTVFHHRYHIVWITKYRYKVLEGALRERIRTIIRQLCKELGVQIVSGVLSRELIGSTLLLRRRNAERGSGWVGCHIRTQPLTQVIG